MTDKCKECSKELTAFEKATASLHKGQPMAGMCGACKFKYTEEKHGTAQAELDQIRAKARERNWRFMEKKKSEGGRQLSAIVSKNCYNALTRIRDAAQQAGNPQSFGAIIEKALAVYVSTLDQSKQGDSTSDTTNVCSNDRINKTEIEPDAKPVEHQTEIPGPDPAPTPESKSKFATVVNLPDILDGIDPDSLTIEDRDQLVLKLHEAYPGKKQAKARIKVLNDAGILFNGHPWTTKQYSDQLTCARRRQDKMEVKK